jgi:HD-GYP domain-containing protein (c-di-GMP phosphodiesterase class II)
MQKARIVLCGMSPRLQGLQWESAGALRIGRHLSADIPLDDPSVARYHAEIFPTGRKWLLRDLANNERHPTWINGERVGRDDCELQPADVVHCGNLALRVTTLESAPPPAPAPPPAAAPAAAGPDGHLRTTGSFVRIEAAAHRTWDQALQDVTRTSAPDERSAQHLLTLLRTGHHLAHLASLDELLHSVLEEAVQSLGAQRGSILLEDPATRRLQLRAVLAPGLPGAAQRAYSRTLADRCFSQGESLLCRDVNAESTLYLSRSIQLGSMSSLICALLRSPRKRLGVLQLDRGPLQSAFDQKDFFIADAVAASVAVGIESALLVEAQREQFIQTVTSLARAVEVRDPYTWGHARRVTDYSLLLSDALKLGPVERHHIEIGTPLHDIGKIGIDDAILRKPSRLTEAEFEQMKQHPVLGANILESIQGLAPMIPIVRHHHERWDGKGYPDRLAGEDIALIARVVAVADAFDAMTSSRPYRPAMPAEKAFAELQEKAGTHFDAACVRAFLRLRPQVEEMLRRK